MNKRRLLIIGSNGMLGQRLVNYFQSKSDFIINCASAEESSFIPEVDYTKIDIANKKDVQLLIKKFYPDFILNAAAYTNVDGCETNRELSWKINVTGVENLAHYAITSDAHIIHVSTDYVFDGKNGPYSEVDNVNPISYYGRTKLAAENVLKASKINFTILRTNVLYGPAKYGRPDFVKWVVNSLLEKKQIRIVTDQINNPTYLDDLVQGFSKVIEFKKTGLYNIGGDEFLSRYDFTKRIAEYFNLDKKLISPIETKELNQPAPRPLKSGLINLKATTELGYLPHKIEETFALMQEELSLI